jgi:hypothetical protein
LACNGVFDETTDTRADARTAYAEENLDAGVDEMVRGTKKDNYCCFLYFIIEIRAAMCYDKASIVFLAPRELKLLPAYLYL